HSLMQRQIINYIGFKISPPGGCSPSACGGPLFWLPEGLRCCGRIGACVELYFFTIVLPENGVGHIGIWRRCISYFLNIISCFLQFGGEHIPSEKIVFSYCLMTKFKPALIGNGIKEARLISGRCTDLCFISFISSFSYFFKSGNSCWCGATVN